MKIIGLTGGIASGKSTVARILTDLGALVIDGDQVAHHLMEPNQPNWVEIVRHFGTKMLNSDMTIDRAQLGSIVFNDPEKLKLLNELVSPRILSTIRDTLDKMKISQPAEVLVLDIPLLFESKMDKLCDQVWVVWVSCDIQIERLMQRNHYTREEALVRIESQMSLDEKARLADIVIDNSFDLEETNHLVSELFQDILQD